MFGRIGKPRKKGDDFMKSKMIYRLAAAAGMAAATAGTLLGAGKLAATWEDCWESYLSRVEVCKAEPDPIFKQSCFNQAQAVLQLCTDGLPEGAPKPGNCTQFYDDLITECKQRCGDNDDVCKQACADAALEVMWKWCAGVTGMDSMSWQEHPTAFSLHEAYHLRVRTDDANVDGVRLYIFRLDAEPEEPGRWFALGNAALEGQFGEIQIWGQTGNMILWPPEVLAQILENGGGTAVVVAAAMSDGNVVGLRQVFVELP
jgi:hypothetical protein